jgi:mRNA-degrading endonuclease RelE of RelBE toxin-antitoxin system
VGTAPRPLAYRIEIGPKASTQLNELDPTVGSAVERKIIWLAQNAAVMVHRRLVGMPEDLVALCKLRVGDWRILYWIYHTENIVRI